MMPDPLAGCTDREVKALGEQAGGTAPLLTVEVPRRRAKLRHERGQVRAEVGKGDVVTLLRSELDGGLQCVE